MCFSKHCIDCSLGPLFTLIQAKISCKWTNDSQRFLLESFDTIHNSPSHIYHSALPFCPSSSWLRKCYAAELSQEAKVVKGLPTRWGACNRTVVFSSEPLAFTCWKDTIAVGSISPEIIILDAITGSQVAVLSGHTNCVNSLIFSPDGMSLVSGSDDKTIKLWDVQTGGVAKTLYGHTNCITSVSISLDNTTIASGSHDKTIRLWDIQSGKCHHVIEQSESVTCVHFSPSDPHCLISARQDETIQQWGTDGCQIGPTYEGANVAFSSDGACFVSCRGKVTMVRNSGSGVILAKFHMANSNINRCCLSPDGKLVAIAAGSIVYVWDITGSDPHLIETFTGHTKFIIYLKFSTSLMSLAYDQSIKFWQIGASSTDSVTAGPKSTPSTSVPIKSITLQAEDGIAILSDLNGVVKTWDLSTGLCRASFQTPATGPSHTDTQLVDNRVILVWWADEKIRIWDVENYKLLQILSAIGYNVKDIRISGDGSKVFCLYQTSIQAWSIWTGEVVGEVEFGDKMVGDSLTIDGSRVWVFIPWGGYEGWDFGIPNSSPVQLFYFPLSRPHLSSILGPGQRDPGPCRIKDAATGKGILQLPGRFAKPVDTWWDSQYLVAHYDSGEVLILDFNHVLPCRDL